MFIQEHKVCALATGSGEYVRCTPIEYNFVDGAFYLFSEGGMKFKGLKDNKNVCLAIFDAGDKVGFGELHSAQISGAAEIVEPFSEEYLKLLQYRKCRSRSISSRLRRWKQNSLIRISRRMDIMHGRRLFLSSLTLRDCNFFASITNLMG